LIQSDYIKDLLDLLLDVDNDGIQARKQIPFLSEMHFDYTGSGLFVFFESTQGIENYRVEKVNLVLDGVIIQSEGCHFSAQGILFFKNGFIDYLEIWCYEGEYPQTELKTYTISQVWNNSKNRIITKLP